MSETSWPVKALKGLIRGYQLVLSPWVGGGCRFHPTCSHYALEALSTHGLWRGLWLAARRIGKCQPFYKGEWIDPVPPRQ